MTPKDIEKLVQKYPLVTNLIKLRETTWFNHNITSLTDGLSYVTIRRQGFRDASNRLERFAPYLYKAFPETAVTKGIIESEVVAIHKMKAALKSRYQYKITGSLLFKKDSHLPISGSIKASGGIYEVLTHAGKLAIENGLLTEKDDYTKLFSNRFTQFFSRYSIAVGSTGNLGLSIGIMSAKLDFKVSFHMSSDAREWKKQKLRSNGVNVIEYQQDYGVAVEQGHKAAKSDPNCFFIGDENSKTLFLRYSEAEKRLKNQFTEMNITVDKQNPLFMYLPCGVDGGPGGVAFGLKLAFGDDVHCIFAEPTHSPCMLLGVYTQLYDNISVQDIGIDNITATDGLVVGRPYGFVGRAMERLIDGYYIISDQEMYDLPGLLNQQQQIQLEPSALAGMLGPLNVEKNKTYFERINVSPEILKNATHLVWATGGGMASKEEIEKYLSLAKI